MLYRNAVCVEYADNLATDLPEREIQCGWLAA
jgi:hypothetical protein